jgi:hypothetical protein
MIEPCSHLRTLCASARNLSPGPKSVTDLAARFCYVGLCAPFAHFWQITQTLAATGHRSDTAAQQWSIVVQLRPLFRILIETLKARSPGKLGNLTPSQVYEVTTTSFSDYYPNSLSRYRAKPGWNPTCNRSSSDPIRYLAEAWTPTLQGAHHHGDAFQLSLK